MNPERERAIPFRNTRRGRILVRSIQLVVLWAILGCFSIAVEVTAGRQLVRLGVAYGHASVVVDSEPAPRGWGVGLDLQPSTPSLWWHNIRTSVIVEHNQIFRYRSLTIGNWILLAAALALVVACTRAKHRGGACPGCGYSRDGLEAGAPCPECGASPEARG